LPVVLSRTLRTTGVPESALAERIGDLDDALAPLTLAYLPSEAGVDLRLTAWLLERPAAEQQLELGVTRLREVLGEHCYGEEQTDLAAVVLEAVRRRRGHIAAAESCTGGRLGAGRQADLSRRSRRDPRARGPSRARSAAAARGRSRPPLMPTLSAPDGTALYYEVFEPARPTCAVFFLPGWSDHAGRWTH